VIVCVHLGKDERGTGIGGARRAAFALEGLRELERDLRAKGIAMEASIDDDAMRGVSDVAREANAKAVVCDFTPLREGRSARERLAKELTCAVIEVDAHNVVPAWLVSDKQEYAARTLRPKIKRALDTFLTEPVGDIDVVHDELQFSASTSTPMIDWDAHLTAARRDGAHVPEVKGWITPGERAALTALCGPDKNAFLPTRLATYAERNKPTSPLSVSRLSPYLNFGHLSPRRAAWEAAKLRGQNDTLDEAIDSYLEELIVRRELSDNFCLHNPRYDSLDGASAWARESLEAHASDKREYVYDYKTLERGRTHDDLWNAAQHELLYLGRMHGFMRMYWAKKILEWTPSPETALTTAIALNDAYALDGLDPNGYVGCMWSIAGIHDQGWKERAVFGKVRYMNYAGCKRKFDIAAYVSRIASEVRAVKTRA
jgi:deoxyribodipyrimidine photo-lyase